MAVLSGDEEVSFKAHAVTSAYGLRCKSYSLKHISQCLCGWLSIDTNNNAANPLTIHPSGHLSFSVSTCSMVQAYRQATAKNYITPKLFSLLRLFPNDVKHLSSILCTLYVVKTSMIFHK